MPNQIGDTNKVLVQGRISYGMAGTTAYPLQVDSSGVLAGVATTITKTIQTELRAAALLAASTQALSSTLALTPYVKRATFFIDHGRTVTTAFGTNGTEYRIEVSEKATGNDTWNPIASVNASLGACASLAASASGTSAAIGATLVTILSTTALVAGDQICWTSGTIEWCKVADITGTASFSVLDGLTAAHTAATGCFAGAEHFVISLNTESVTRARVVINNNASGTTQAIISRIACITET